MSSPHSDLPVSGPTWKQQAQNDSLDDRASFAAASIRAAVVGGKDDSDELAEWFNPGFLITTAEIIAKLRSALRVAEQRNAVLESAVKQYAGVEGEEDLTEMARAKCYANERHPASDRQTLAAMVCSAALKLATVGRGKYVRGDIAALHLAADYIANATPRVRSAPGSADEAASTRGPAR